MNAQEPRQMVVPKPGVYGRSVMMPAMVPTHVSPEELNWPVIDISGPKPVLIVPAKENELKPRGETERAP